MKLQEIQKTLKAPKGQKNTFGNYMYRSCEDILEAVKPLLGNSVLTLSDEIVELGGRVYVKATATFSDGESVKVVTAFAREAESKKGMDEAQITGSSSSYARKYALNGLFLIDDNKDPDTRDNSEPTPKKKPLLKPEQIDVIFEKLTKGEITKKTDQEIIALAESKYTVTDVQKTNIKKRFAEFKALEQKLAKETITKKLQGQK